MSLKIKLLNKISNYIKIEFNQEYLLDYYYYQSLSDISSCIVAKLVDVLPISRLDVIFSTYYDLQYYFFLNSYNLLFVLGLAKFCLSFSSNFFL